MPRTENMVQRRRVYDEHCKARAAKDTRKVVVIADEGKSEGHPKLALDGEHLPTGR
jgi:hypothetical protein